MSLWDRRIKNSFLNPKCQHADKNGLQLFLLFTKCFVGSSFSARFLYYSNSKLKMTSFKNFVPSRRESEGLNPPSLATGIMLSSDRRSDDRLELLLGVFETEQEKTLANPTSSCGARWRAPVGPEFPITQQLRSDYFA